MAGRLHTHNDAHTAMHMCDLAELPAPKAPIVRSLRLTDTQLCAAVAEASRLRLVQRFGAEQAAARAVIHVMAWSALHLALKETSDELSSRLPVALKAELAVRKISESGSEQHEFISAGVMRLREWLAECDELHKCKSVDGMINAAAQVFCRGGDARRVEALSSIVRTVEGAVSGIPLDSTPTAHGKRTRESRRGSCGSRIALPKRRRRRQWDFTPSPSPSPSYCDASYA